MRSAAIFVGVLASAAIAQPHGHSHGRRQHLHGHPKRDLVTEWTTEIQTITVTEWIDETTTEWITPGVTPTNAESSAAPTTNVPGQFFEGSSQAAPSTPTFVPKPTSEAPETQAYVPPPASTSVVAPPVQVAPTTAALAASPAPSGSSGVSSATSEHTGDLTYYALGMGACGFDDSGKDMTENIVALSYLVMGEQSNGNPMCGKTISISYGGKTITATVRDKCMGCAADAIDVSEAAFVSLLGSTGVGRKAVNWWFN
ncbi:allergen Asp f 7-like protein [Phialemonium atrogriseum]|uniref:Allergen Asp f 7-like protein n=1 Tax=Phialemonium atrogriseum TaxID=1093897 RepID=A0AAJ0CAZ1_9PEZI|nr:allergen Asp f 7-like protein [Phialemonium atrogriseum]KAK1770961.1 allergen Asp f 7-like protein [Phialemonium atrogriseum]